MLPSFPNLIHNSFTSCITIITGVRVLFYGYTIVTIVGLKLKRTDYLRLLKNIFPFIITITELNEGFRVAITV